MDFLAAASRVSNSVGLRRGPGISFSSKTAEDTDIVG